MQDQLTNTTSSSFYCPSFSSYATNQVANIAAKVALNEHQQQQHQENDSGEDQNEDDCDFEFVSVRKNPDENDAAALFKVDGKGGEEESFPLFDRSLLSDFYNITIDRDRDADVASSSSSEENDDDADDADDMEGVQPGTYCVWKPKPPPSSPGRCEKSNSTGSSATRKWRLRDLLRRSISDGGARGLRRAEGVTSSSSSSSPATVVKGVKTTASFKGKRWEKVMSAHEEFYVRSKAKKEEEKRRSYLPYRQGLVGFFANANYVNGSGGFGLGRTFPPF